MTYPAKIILFGEYGIILNSMALAVPFRRFSGQLRFPDVLSGDRSQKEIESNAVLIKLNQFFKNNEVRFQFLNVDYFENDIKKGLYFDSSIPEGSGLGSSGALTAAIYHKYATPEAQNEFKLTRTNLALIESCFHGLSSGIDPLISFLKKPLLIENNTSFNADIDLSSFLDNYTLFLINSHSMGRTDILVSSFMKQYNRTDFKEKIDIEYIPLINETIKAVLNSDFVAFEKLMVRYSQFQLTYFSAMIPQEMTNYFKHGIYSGDFYLKLCGSGGGGFTLAIARDRQKAESYFILNHLDYTVV
jgi:mevalonate kinase